MTYLDKDGDECSLVTISVPTIPNWDSMPEAEKCKVYCKKLICENNKCKKH